MKRVIFTHAVAVSIGVWVTLLGNFAYDHVLNAPALNRRNR